MNRNSDEWTIYPRATAAAGIATADPGTSAGEPVCTPVQAGLVGWWRAEGNALDTLGPNHGTLRPDAGFTPGLVGQAFSFTGATNSYVEVPDAAALRLTKELTIEFWLKRRQLDAPTRPFADYIIEKGGDWTGGILNYAVAVHNPDYSHCLHFVFAGGWRGGGSVADTNWHHCAVVAVHGQSNPTFYIDGVDQPLTYSEGAGSLNLNPSTGPLHIVRSWIQSLAGITSVEHSWTNLRFTIVRSLLRRFRPSTALEAQASA